MKMEARVPDASLGQLIANTAVNPGETGKQEVEPEDVPEEGDGKPFEQNLAEGFDNVSDIEKATIAGIIAEKGEEALSEGQKLIYEA